MKWINIDKRTGLNLISAIILVAGLGSAFLLYQKAYNYENSVPGYEIIDGKAYPIMPENSRKYLKELELYGGKMAVIGDEIERLFFGLWNGKSLALVIAGISIIISFGVYYVANHLPSHLKRDGRHEKHMG